MKISAEVVYEEAGTWKGYVARTRFINDKPIAPSSPLALVAAGQTPEEAIEWLKKQYDKLGRGLVEFEVEDNPKYKS